MDSGKDDLLVTSKHKSSDLLQSCLRFNAAAATSYRRNDAERTVRVASVLNFDDCACASTGTDVRRGLEFMFEKDIATKDFGMPVRTVQRQFRHQPFVGISDNVAHLGQFGQVF